MEIKYFIPFLALVLGVTSLGCAKKTESTFREFAVLKGYQLGDDISNTLLADLAVFTYLSRNPLNITEYGEGSKDPKEILSKHIPPNSAKFSRALELALLETSMHNEGSSVLTKDNVCGQLQVNGRAYLSDLVKQLNARYKNFSNSELRGMVAKQTGIIMKQAGCR